LFGVEKQPIAKYSVFNDANLIFASKYKLTLPAEIELLKDIEHQRIILVKKYKDNRHFLLKR